MERPLKLMEAAVSQPLRSCNESQKRRFSDLPDNVVHHIFSFLGLEDLFRFIHASKRCRQLYLTNPFLSFDWTDFSTIPLACYLFLNYLDRLLVERKGRKIFSFCIRWGFHGSDVEAYRIISWLHVAVECNVEVLDLELFCGQWQKIEFPICLLRCGSLSSVAVNLHGGFLVLPSSIGFSSLQSLSITSVKVAINFGEWISSFCECLEELRLENIEEIYNVSIKSSSLLRFTLVESRLASQLRHLRIAGGKLEVVDVLEGARLFLEPKEDTDYNLHRILLDVSRAKDLSLHEVMIKVLFEQVYPCPGLNYVQALCVYTSCLNNDLVPAMISLLIGMPNLKTLSIKSSALFPKTRVIEREHCSLKSCASSADCSASKGLHQPIKSFTPSANTKVSGRGHYSIMSCASAANFSASKRKHCEITSSTPSANNNASGFDARYWEAQRLRFICHVEMVEIELFEGINALELGLFLLKHAKKLKMMVVFHSPSLPSDVYMKIQNCRMGTAATVLFREK